MNHRISSLFLDKTALADDILADMRVSSIAFVGLDLASSARKLKRMRFPMMVTNTRVGLFMTADTLSYDNETKISFFDLVISPLL